MASRRTRCPCDGIFGLQEVPRSGNVAAKTESSKGVRGQGVAEGFAEMPGDSAGLQPGWDGQVGTRTRTRMRSLEESVSSSLQPGRFICLFFFKTKLKITSQNP